MAENKLEPRLTKAGMWEVIRTPGGGEIPDRLKGIYTSSSMAQAAISAFQAGIQAKVKAPSANRNSN